MRSVEALSLSELLSSDGGTGVLLNTSRDPDAKLTFLRTPGGTLASRGGQLVVKIPTTARAADAVEREGRMLVELRRRQLGADLAATVPRYVATHRLDDRQVLVSTALPGAPMTVAYHEWLHTARRGTVRRDFALALGWLRMFQDRTAGIQGPVAWPAGVAEELETRWAGNVELPAALLRLDRAHQHLAGQVLPTTAVHGDYWLGNILVSGGRVTGVVDWEHGRTDGCPLADLARFWVSYALYLDRHARPGGRVAGHRDLRRIGFAPAITWALVGRSWLPRMLRGILGQALIDLGLPAWLWYDVALTGLAEVAATANDDEFATGHLELVAALPVRPRRARR